MTLYSDRRSPLVMIRVNGKDSPEFMAARISFRWTDRIGKRSDASLVLSDPDRKFRDELLQADDHYQIAHGYPGNLSRIRNFRLKDWVPNHDTSPYRVNLTLKDTGVPPKQFQGNTPVGSEPYKTRSPKNWGKIQTSDIAKRISRRHGLTAIVDASEDIDRYAYVQPGNVSDYGYLRRLAEVIDFEFFQDGERLYYRKKPYDERPRRVFYYHPTGGRDTLLLKFTPKAKVTTVSVKPRAVDVQVAESPWIVQERIAVAEEVSALFNEPSSRAEEAVDLLTQVRVPADVVSAESVRKLLQSNPGSVSDQQLYEQRMAELDLRMQELQAARKVEEEAKKGSGKVAHKQGAKPTGTHNHGDKKCPAAQQKPGKTPTGNAPGEGVQGHVRLELSDRSSAAYGGTPEIGGAQASIQTTAGTQAQRNKIACAAHSKRTDKAVTATALFKGDPALVAKANYQFEGVGVMFSGSWYAKEATHTVDTQYRVSMSLKKGKLKRSKKGTQNDANANSAGDQQSSGQASDVAINLETRGVNVWSQQTQNQYDTSTAQTNEGFHTPNGEWVPRPPSTAVPPR